MPRLHNPFDPDEDMTQWKAWEKAHRDDPIDSVSDYPAEFKMKTNSEFGKANNVITIRGAKPTDEVYDLYVVCQHIEEMYQGYLKIADFLTDGREDLMMLGRVMQAGEQWFNGMAAPETEKRSTL